MKRLITKISFLFLTLNIGYHAPSFANASDTLDSLVAGATFNYTGGDHRKLDQIGRHAVSFGRLRYYNPTNPVNLINLTPPSIGTPNCSSININLGSFDIISLDEAVAILRRVANEALTYGFGLALQSMCSPCWSGMQTLREQLNRFNQANRQTCQFAKNMINDLTDNGDRLRFFDGMCETNSLASGDDNYLCKLGDALSVDHVENAIDEMEGWLPAIGEDPTVVLKHGNVIYWGFNRIVSGGEMPQDVFSPDLSKLILGVPHGDQNKQYSMAEAAMNLFGYYSSGAKEDTDGDPGQENLFSGYQVPAIEYLSSIYKDPIDCSNSANCAEIYQCKDVRIKDDTHQCLWHIEPRSKKNYTAVLNEYRQNFPTYCSDEVQHPTLVDVMHCQVQATFKKLLQDGEGSLSDLQRNIIKASNPAIVRAFAVGESSHINTLDSILSESLGKYLTYDLIASYVSQMAIFTSMNLEYVEKETTVGPAELKQIREAIKEKMEQVQHIADLAKKELKDLQQNEAFTHVLEEYERALSEKATTFVFK